MTPSKETIISEARNSLWNMDDVERLSLFPVPVTLGPPRGRHSLEAQARERQAGYARGDGTRNRGRGDMEPEFTELFVLYY